VVAAGDVVTDDSAGGTACCATSSVLAGDTGRSSPPTMTVVDAEVAGPLPAASANCVSIRRRVAALEAASVAACAIMGTVPTTTTVAAAIAQRRGCHATAARVRSAGRLQESGSWGVIVVMSSGRPVQAHVIRIA
jgi:hypothetical protein